MNTHFSNKKKANLSQNERLLKTIYSRHKTKCQYSPHGYRSISKQKIKNQINKVVRYAQRQDKISWQQKVEYNEANPLIVQDLIEYKQQTNIRTSLTPKSLGNYRKVQQRQVQSTKAGDHKGKQLFQASGRYNLQQLLQRKKQEPSQPKGQRDRERERQRDKQRDKQRERQQQEHRFNSRHKRNHYILESRLNQDHTIKINQRERDDLVNVKAFLTQDQYIKFGQRFPQKFKRIGLLGRGGFSVVWLGIHRSSKRKVAIKQILTKNPHQTHLKQIWFGSYFFQKGGQPRQQFESHIGINNICKLYRYDIRQIDTWLYYQLCDQSLGSCVFQLKGEHINGQRTYRVCACLFQIQYKQLIYKMRENGIELKILITQIAKALMLINSHNIVHSDLKTQNILIRTRKKDEGTKCSNYISGIKLIDFGSSFLFTNLKQFSMATPQYMPPQILNYILYQNKLDYDQQMLLKMQKYKHPWVIDIWSLGCVVLQLISGIPLWMSVQTRVQLSHVTVKGLYAVKNRVFSKIIQKQIQVVHNLDYHLDQHNYSRIIVREDVRRVLKRMLSLNPDQRISPFQVLIQFGVDCQPVRIPSF